MKNKLALAEAVVEAARLEHKLAHYVGGEIQLYSEMVEGLGDYEKEHNDKVMSWIKSRIPLGDALRKLDEKTK